MKEEREFLFTPNLYRNGGGMGFTKIHRSFGGTGPHVSKMGAYWDEVTILVPPSGLCSSTRRAILCERIGCGCNSHQRPI